MANWVPVEVPQEWRPFEALEGTERTLAYAAKDWPNVGPFCWNRPASVAWCLEVSSQPLRRPSRLNRVREGAFPRDAWPRDREWPRDGRCGVETPQRRYPRTGECWNWRLGGCTSSRAWSPWGNNIPPRHPRGCWLSSWRQRLLLWPRLSLARNGGSWQRQRQQRQHLGMSWPLGLASYESRICSDPPHLLSRHWSRTHTLVRKNISKSFLVAVHYYSGMELASSLHYWDFFRKIVRTSAQKQDCDLTEATKAPKNPSAVKVPSSRVDALVCRCKRVGTRGIAMDRWPRYWLMTDDSRWKQQQH